MSRLVLGIDPGMTGAIAAIDLDTHELVSVIDTPVAGGQIAVPLLATHLVATQAIGRIVSVVIERVSSMPGQGVASTFKFGRTLGTVEGFYGATLPVLMVEPQAWKRTFALVGKDKDAARLAAIQRGPAAADLFARKKDGGRADAALIALHHAQTGVFGQVAS